jgi:hypothetical protein
MSIALKPCKYDASSIVTQNAVTAFTVPVRPALAFPSCTHSQFQAHSDRSVSSVEEDEMALCAYLMYPRPR